MTKSRKNTHRTYWKRHAIICAVGALVLWLSIFILIWVTDGWPYVAKDLGYFTAFVALLFAIGMFLGIFNPEKQYDD